MQCISIRLALKVLKPFAFAKITSSRGQIRDAPQHSCEFYIHQTFNGSGILKGKIRICIKIRKKLSVRVKFDQMLDHDLYYINYIKQFLRS